VVAEAVGSKEFAETLTRENEVQISFVRSRNGKTRTIPVWFALEEGRVHLLPMYGLRTKWYQDVEKSGKVELSAKGKKLGAAPQIVRDEARIEHIKSLFARKYGAQDVKRYYPTSEVALEVPL
jgi:hypothetical protein